MSPDSREPREDETDAGVPVAELATLREEPRSGFLGRIRRTIQRRQLGSDVAEMSVSGVMTVFMELLRALFGMVEEAGRNDKGEQR